MNQQQPRWTPAEDAHLAPYVGGRISMALAEAIGAKIGRSGAAVVGRLRFLTNPEHERRRRDKERPPRRRRQKKRAGDTSHLKQRKCLMCRVVFFYDPRRENFFRCDAHRNLDGYMAEGGSRGGQRGRTAL